MNKHLLSILFAILPFMSLAQGAATTNSSDKKIADGAIFNFQPNGTLLYKDFQNNDLSLQWLYGAMKANRMAVLSNKAHFEIFSFIPASQVGNPSAINNASIQASVVRAYLKTQYGISHESCSFAIDTTQGMQNAVQLQIVSGPVSSYSNTKIAYSLQSNTAAARAAMNEYQPTVPYMSYLMYMARRNTGIGSGGSFYSLRDGAWEKEDFNEFAKSAKLSELAAVGGLSLYIKQPNGTYVPATVQDIDSGVNILYSRAADGTYTFASADNILAVAKANNASFPTSAYLSSLQEGFGPTKTIVEERIIKDTKGYRDFPIFGFKTNLLTWAGGTPNIGVEFYMGNMVSLELSGQYTWLTGFLGDQKAYYNWAAGGELRFWTKADKRFNGLFIGIYGNAGQYDYKFGQIGYQGDFYSAGLSIGYVLPVGRHFNVEFALAGGYLQYQNTKYHWVGDKNVPLDPLNPVETTWKIFPTKATIALLWKF